MVKQKEGEEEKKQEKKQEKQAQAPKEQSELLEYQNVQQQLQMIVMQKQQMMAQIAELDKASEEVGKSSGGSFYRYVGSVIVPKKKEDLAKELTAEKQELQDRLELFSNQEEKLRKRFTELRKKLEAQVEQEKQARGSRGGIGVSAGEGAKISG